MRIITVEEHFHRPEAVARVLELAGPWPVTPGAGFGDFLQNSLPDRDCAELCRKVNDDLAQQISEHSTRFRGFATQPLHDPATTADELRRCIDELGFVGALTMGACGGRFLDDERFEPVLAAAERLDLPIYVHPGMPGQAVSAAYYAGNWPAAAQFLFAGPGFRWHAEAGIHIVRLILSGALDRHSNLKLLSGHWGEFVAGWLDRLDEVFSWGSVGLERAPSTYYCSQVWATPAGMYNQNQLNFIHSEDFPYVIRGNISEFLEQADLTDDQRNAIGHGNAERVLRL
jgi:uncharacterized protein